MQNIEIRNRSIISYLETKDIIVLKYLGQSFKTFIHTVFLGLALKKQLDETWKVAIQCAEQYKESILPPLFYYEPNKSESSFMAIYNISNTSSYEDNHIEIAKNLEVKFPLDISEFFSSNETESVLLCLNGPIHLSLSSSVEKEIYQHFINKGLETNLGISPDYNHNDYWTSSYLRPSSLPEMISVISRHKTIICTDNSWLTLANVFPNKKVIGIFGPTLPKSTTKINSMKIIQLFDNEPFQEKYSKKMCTCENPKICHRGYFSKKISFCLNVSSLEIIKKIENLI